MIIGSAIPAITQNVTDLVRSPRRYLRGITPVTRKAVLLADHRLISTGLQWSSQSFCIIELSMRHGPHPVSSIAVCENRAPTPRLQLTLKFSFCSKEIALVLFACCTRRAVS